MSDRLRKGLATSRLLASGDGFSVCDEVCRAGPKDPVFEEQHAWISVSAVLSGNFVYRSKRGRVLMAPGSLLLGQQGNCFCCNHDHGVGDRCVAFYFDPAWIEEFAAEIPRVRRTRFAMHRVPPLQTLVPLLSDVRALADGGESSAGQELALRMAGAAFRLVHGGSDLRVNSRDERRMTEAVRSIEERLTEPLSIATLAREVGMSRYHFLRTFRRTIGETPYRYVLSRRLVVVAKRLSSTSDNILDTALACGFGDLSEFTRRFRARFGVTPAMYRRRMHPVHRARDHFGPVHTLNCP
jgi:AraC family transcriptional regulator